mmetsp:Transcript_28115/g.82740  ORF Transcript_28115/g.82740 Transcript_28115/m.82740 type:complete len:259 (+) Transcript_28115:302-1078(+)
MVLPVSTPPLTAAKRISHAAAPPPNATRDSSRTATSNATRSAAVLRARNGNRMRPAAAGGTMEGRRCLLRATRLPRPSMPSSSTSSRKPAPPSAAADDSDLLADSPASSAASPRRAARSVTDRSASRVAASDDDEEADASVATTGTSSSLSGLTASRRTSAAALPPRGEGSRVGGPSPRGLQAHRSRSSSAANERIMGGDCADKKDDRSREEEEDISVEKGSTPPLLRCLLGSRVWGSLTVDLSSSGGTTCGRFVTKD